MAREALWEGDAVRDPSNDVIRNQKRRETMKRLTAAIAITLFATGVWAGDPYQGFAVGNPDLRTVAFDAADVVGVQPGVGSSIDRYHGWADDNPDLFQRFDAEVTDHTPPDIYGGLNGNPDL